MPINIRMEERMQRTMYLTTLFSAAMLIVLPSHAADLIVSAQDGKFVRVEGQATFPQPAPPDSLVVLDASTSPPTLKGTVEGIEHTVQGPPQAVAITPDGKLIVVGAPSRYDYTAKKELLDNFLQTIDNSGAAPKLLDKVDLGAHPNGLSINREGTLLLAACTDGTVKALAIEGNKVRLLDSFKVGQKRLSGISFTHDGKAAIVAMRDENGAAVLSIDGIKVTLTDEKISTGVSPYAVDVSGDGKWAVIGNTGTASAGLPGKTFGDVDTVTLIDTSMRPFRAVQHLTVPATPEGVAISPDGRWIAVNSMAGSSLRSDNPGRNKLGKLTLFAIRDGAAVKVNDVPGGEAAQGVVFSQDGKTVLLQMDVERAIGVYAIRDGKLVDTGERIKLAAGPVSMRSMPR
jgi:DNA-binding beta-propeller fold protein YncE